MSTPVSIGGVVTLLVLSTITLVQPVEGGAFLGRPSHAPVLSGAPSQEVEEALLKEIEVELGDRHRSGAEGRLAQIKKALGPMFTAMPKNEQGKLDHGVVRYILHRLFVQRHGWFIQGLRPGGEAWDAVSPTDILHDQVPDHIQNVFESRIGGTGLSLDELSVLAAILEHMIHSEAAERLDFSYRAVGLTLQDSVSSVAAQEVMDMYMMLYLQGANTSAMSLAKATDMKERLPKTYGNWNETRKFMREVQHSVAFGRTHFDFANVLGVVEEIGERYGRWQNQECSQLKQQLSRIGDERSGRVRLADFYKAAVEEGMWQFSESVDYLRQLGALDESDPANLQVIVPNYINSPSNCIASSSYYSVCCIDECEDLLGSIEDKLRKPVATEREIIDVVAALPSATRAPNRDLSPLLRSRLTEVADHHNGSIPLHGRLFLQWMHLAYPMECSFPHLSGTTSPMTSSEYMRKTGSRAASTRKDMTGHIFESSSSGDKQDSEEGSCSMWSMEEDLVSTHRLTSTETAPSRAGSGVVSNLRVALLGTALVSALVATVRTFMSGIAAVPGRQAGKADVWADAWKASQSKYMV
jgi:hypothetical protein